MHELEKNNNKKGRETGASVQEMTERWQADGWKHTAIQQRRKTQARSQVEQITAEQDAGGKKEEAQRGEKRRRKQETHTQQTADQSHQPGFPAARCFSV